MPLAVPMMEEMLAALPPLGMEARVIDIACGTGNAGYAVAASYPTAHVTLLDRDADLLSIARAKLDEISSGASVYQHEILVDSSTLPGAPYDVVVASLALHDMIGQDVEGPEAEGRYELLFQGIRESLVDGGHLIVADHTGALGLYRQLKAMERAGFSDVDCAWRTDDYFVAGGRVSL